MAEENRTAEAPETSSPETVGPAPQIVKQDTTVGTAETAPEAVATTATTKTKATETAELPVNESQPKTTPADDQVTTDAAPPTAENVASDILPPQHWTALPVENDDDADSALGDDNESSTASITSSILHYRTIKGRTFHSEQGNASYWAANDERQSEVMDINHHVLTMGLGDKLYHSPLDREKLRNVLDIGTGTGIWAIDFADQHPDAQIIGTDISPIQPTWVPPNIRFDIEDCTREWTFPSNSQDFIHIRWLIGSIPDWSALYAEAFRVCRPGAWFETHEPSSIIVSDDGSVEETSAMGQWGKFFIEGGKKIGNSFTVFEDEMQRKAMEAAGFVDIQEYKFTTPLGTWPRDPVQKEMGRFLSYAWGSDIEGFVVFMAQVLKWSNEEIQVYIAHLRRELRDKSIHGYYPQRVVWGRKPDDA